MQTKIIERYFFFSLLLAVLVFTFFVFRPFWIVLVLGFSLSVVLYPVFKYFKKIKCPNWLASLLTVLLFIIVLCVPLFSIGYLVFNESQNIYHSVLISGNAGQFVTLIGDKINQVLPAGTSFNVNEKISSFVYYLTNNLTGVFSATFSFLFSFVLLILAIFYILMDGEEWKKGLTTFIPLSETDNKKILNKLSKTINGVIKGVLIITLVQGILMGVGLTIFHIPNAVLLGAVAGIASQIPVVGTALISIPVIIFLFVTGHTISAIGFLVWSAITVGLVNNLLVPYVIGNKINIPPFLTLFAILGGLALLGPVGILIGPLAISFLYVLVSIYQEEFRQNNNL